MKWYQVKLKMSKVGYKNKFFTGVSIAKNAEIAKQQAVEFIKKEIEAKINLSINVEAIKCEIIKKEFLINPENY